ncbi:MAG: CoA transferase [Chloroflexi bacterium]|nr:CoA transferase [Chloroflexota bacterium]
MTGIPTHHGPLEGYRILDLTDEKGWLAGKVLADLGAEVILVESPGGNPARYRRIYGSNAAALRQAQGGAYWLAFNTGKRSVTLDLSKPGGKKSFLSLAGTADAIIESFSPGWLEAQELSYETLSRANPGLVLTSITPFGQSGPYKSFQASDLISMAMGGLMHVTGDPDRRPLRIGLPQSYLHAGLHAAIGTLIALHARERLGVGQWVDVSIHESVVRCLTHDLPMWEFGHDLMQRCGPGHYFGKLPYREIWPCADGAVAFRIVGGVGGKRISYLVDWMRREGMAGALDNVDWDRANLADLTPAEMESWDRSFLAFFQRHTRAELYAEAQAIGLPLCPVNTVPEVMVEPQLMFRQFWAFLEHPERRASIPYPGVPYHFSGGNVSVSRRAPQVGQDTQSVLEEAAQRRPPRTAPSRPAGTSSTAALAGLKVLDLTHQLTGPLITKYLADFGATVVKLESTTRPDLTRVSQPFQGGKPGINLSGSFVNYNTNKLSLGLDLKRPEARPIVEKLVKWADVFVENLGPGAAAKLGLDYGAVSRLHPDIIMLSTTAQGQGGPSSLAPGYGWNLNGLCGFTDVVGWPDRPPVSPHVAYTDVVAPGYGVVALLAALDHRRPDAHRDEGQYIDLSQLEAGLSFLAPTLLDYAINGETPRLQGNRSPDHAPHNVYPCRGQDPSASSGHGRSKTLGTEWCAIAVSNQEEWQALVKTMGGPEWSLQERFQSLEGRKENEDELDALISAWTVQYEPRELMLRLQAAGVPAGMVQTAADLWSEDPQLQHRQYLVSQPHKAMGRCTFQGWPVKLSLTPVRPGTAPCLGEHTEYVCKEILGLSDEELADLLAKGVVETG